MGQPAENDAAVRAFREAADIVNQVRTEHLTASMRAPAASHLFTAEQRILARAEALSSRVTPPEETP